MCCIRSQTPGPGERILLLFQMTQAQFPAPKLLSPVRSVLGAPAPPSGLCKACPHMHTPLHIHTCIYKTKNNETESIKNPPWTNDKGPVSAPVLNLWVVAPLANLHLQNYLYYDS